MSQTTATIRERNIDILRGISILAVVAYHFELFKPITDQGLYGVLLFFLISGYCMEISLKASSGALEFLARRESRLVPALIVCAVITQLVESSFPDIRPDRLQTWLDVAKNAVCIPMVDLPCGVANRLAEGSGSYTMVDGAYWSLRVEFGFYAVLLVLYYVIAKRLHLLALLAVAIGAGVWLHMFGGARPMREFVPYLPYFATGAAIFEIRNGNRRYGWATLSASVLTFFAFVALGIGPLSIPTNVWAYVLCTALLLTAAAVPDLTRSKAALLAAPIRVVLFFGLISYPLYLLHQDIGHVLVGKWQAVPLHLLWALAVLVLLAYAVHVAVEYRCERWVKAWFRSGSALRPIAHRANHRFQHSSEIAKQGQ